MKQGVLVDSMTRQYVGDYVGQIIDEGVEIVTDLLPDGMYEPIHVDGVWVNGLSQTEIDVLNTLTIVKTPEQVDIEQLRTNQELIQLALDELLMGGV